MIQIADQKMKKVYEMAESVAVSRASVLITGESGTGKELLARFIHNKSPRCGKRFIALNCAAVPEGLLESELFGFEKGAFTGADQRKPGKFELAHESTFLLDEVSELPLLLQAKLLRVLQEGEVERLGGSAPIKVNVRIIATSNRSLEKMVKDGEFREDLYYRLNVIPLQIPALRVRPLDIEMLANSFVAASCEENGLQAKRLNDLAMRKLKTYRWPGNVRELQNIIERSILLNPAQEIGEEHILLPETADAVETPVQPFSPGMTVGEAERLLIMKTLEFTSQNRTRAAELLGISIRTLRNKLNEYKGGLDEQSFDKTTNGLGASLALRSLRHNVTASNIANAETPGFKAKKVDFEDALARAIDLEGIGGEMANSPEHFAMSTGAISRAKADVYDNPEGNTTNDQNTVDLEREMANLQENSILYKAALQLMNKKLGALKYAATDGGR